MRKAQSSSSPSKLLLVTLAMAVLASRQLLLSTTTYLSSSSSSSYYQTKSDFGIRYSYERIDPPLLSYLTHPNDDNDDIILRLPPPIADGGSGRGSPTAVRDHDDIVDAVFAIAIGSKLQDVILFLSSLRDTGFVGDVVLGVLPQSHRDMPGDLWEYLLSVNDNSGKMNVIVHALTLYVNPRHAISLTHGRDFYYNTSSERYIKDVRPQYRTLSQIRYEYYAAWLFQPERPVLGQMRQYRYGRIMLTDLRDVYFQRNPFTTESDYELPPHTEMKNTLMVFEEYPTRINDQSKNRGWILKARGRHELERIGDNYISCSGTTIGGYDAIQTYLLHMIKSFDESPQCNNVLGCDQGHHNYLLYSGRLMKPTFLSDEHHQSLPTIDQIMIGKQGYSIVNTVGLLAKREDNQRKKIITPLRSVGIVHNVTDEVLNWDGTVTPILHQYDRDEELRHIMTVRGQRYVRHWKESKQTL